MINLTPQGRGYTPPSSRTNSIVLRRAIHTPPMVDGVSLMSYPSFHVSLVRREHMDELLLTLHQMYQQQDRDDVPDVFVFPSSHG